MAKGNIDPAFQAAPYLGDSSHDPIEFARRHNLTKYKAIKQRQDEIKESTQKGLQDLMLDLKGWEDQEGFKEIMDRQDKALKLFTDLSKKGLNLTSPKTSQEIEAYRTINAYHTGTKQMVDEWDRNKKAYDIVTEAVKQDSMKPESERKIDADATRENVSKAMSGVKIADRKMAIENLLVFKPEIGDVHKYVKDNLDLIPKPDVITEPYVDEATGQTVNRTREVETPSYIKEKEAAMRRLFQTMPKPEKNAIKQAREKDSTLDVMSDEDYFVSMYVPQFKQRFVDKIAGNGNGLAIDVDFGSKKVKMIPGEKDTKEYPFGDRTYVNKYNIGSSTPVEVPIGKEGSTYFKGETWAPLTNGGNVEATPSFYSIDRDEIVFRSTTQQMAPFMMNNMAFAVPYKNLGNKADKIPIIVDGKRTTLGEYRKTMGKDEVKPAVKLIGGKSYVGAYIPSANKKK